MLVLFRNISRKMKIRLRIDANFFLLLRQVLEFTFFIVSTPRVGIESVRPLGLNFHEIEGGPLGLDQVKCVVTSGFSPFFFTKIFECALSGTNFKSCLMCAILKE